MAHNTNPSGQEEAQSPVQSKDDISENNARKIRFLDAEASSDSGAADSNAQNSDAASNAAQKKNKSHLLAKHDRIMEDLLKQLYELPILLQNTKKIMEDPRVEVELKKVIDLAATANSWSSDVEDVREKVRRDEKRSMSDFDLLVYNLRRYRVLLHELDGTLAVNMEILEKSADLLEKVQEHKLRRHRELHRQDHDDIRISKKQKNEAQKNIRGSDNKPPGSRPDRDGEDDIQMKSTPGNDDPKTQALAPETGSERVGVQELPEIIITPPASVDDSEVAMQATTWEDEATDTGLAEADEMMDSIYDLYGMSCDKDTIEDEVEDYEKLINQILETLTAFAVQLRPEGEFDTKIAYQMDRILQLSRGDVEKEWEISQLRLDLLQGGGESVEERVLYLLKSYRILLHALVSYGLQMEGRVTEKIIEVHELMSQYQNSLPDIEEETSSQEWDGDVKSEFAESLESLEVEHVFQDGNCSCGTFCHFARARPVTPEGELDATERGIRDWYEKTQAAIKEHAYSIAVFLKLHTEQVKAGDTVDPIILWHAKKLRDLNVGKQREGLEPQQYDQSLEETRVELKVFRQQLINYFYECQDSGSLMELDPEVVAACIELLKANFQQHWDIEKKRVLGSVSETKE
ncbi:uncharacterized protein LY89DRAFT_673070 [Mollisia scopiformis]|uniref:Uncharacterized protein n=1 Tax=Mollisia scopiformis TaxID=149040 RepID=A0A194WYC0_MOLSC|nr:uncharacterized protein LY89DRAFT_673070 [Mollisia scopiformis]KUJ12966.1 hypothetical protein LY89DRAFT_673070 [Mollisia scopiformis]